MGDGFAFLRGVVVLRWGPLIMLSDVAVLLIRSQLQRMGVLYARPVFDEWALLGLTAAGARVLAYEGPRAEEFAKTLPADAMFLRAAMTQREYAVGDFEFATDAPGQHLDAFMRVGSAAYLVCNHTTGSMDDIRRDPLWRKAQVAWFDLGERFRADPLE